MGKNNFQSPNDTFKVLENNSLVTKIDDGSKYCKQLFFKLFFDYISFTALGLLRPLSQNTFFFWIQGALKKC